MNINNYDLILDTPFFYQHKLSILLNPSQVTVRSDISLLMEGKWVTAIPLCMADVLNKQLENLQKQLRVEAQDLFKSASETALPLMRAVNHTIPLIDKKA
ncbi:hypothetical protein FRB99_004342, partial [Tulasnella sp. 403]